MAVLDILSNTQMVLRIRIVCYGILIFFSFFIFVGVAVMKDKSPSAIVGDASFCPLYYSVEDGRANIGPASNCNFPLAIAIMWQLLFLLFRVGTLVLLMLGKFTSDFVLFSDMMEAAYVVTEFFGFFFTFIGACILSAGTNSTCDAVPGICGSESLLADSYSASKAAQAGAWISTFLWAGVFLVGFFSMYRAGKIPFIQSGTPASENATDGTSPQPSNPDDMAKY